MSERVVLRTVVGSDGRLTIPPEIRRLSGLAAWRRIGGHEIYR